MKYLFAFILVLWAQDAVAERGMASYYTSVETRGHRTASGRPLRDHELTAAHRSLPFGSKVRVTNLRNGRSAIVTITDRGPFVRGRIIDLSLAGKRALGMSGLAHVTVERLPTSNCRILPRGKNRWQDCSALGRGF